MIKQLCKILTCLSFQVIHVCHINIATITVKQHDNSQTNCRFCCGNCQNKENKNFTGGGPIIVGKSHQVGIDPQQHQFNANQHQDHISTIDEHANQTQTKQHG